MLLSCKNVRFESMRAFMCVSFVNLLLFFPLRCDTKLSFCTFSLLWNIFFLQLIFLSFSVGFSFERWIRLQIVLLFTIVYVCIILCVSNFFLVFFGMWHFMRLECHQFQHDDCTFILMLVIFLFLCLHQTNSSGIKKPLAL